MGNARSKSVGSHQDKGIGPLIAGFIIALIALGLPLIGVTVNLELGLVAFVGAFVLLAYGFWKWEKSSNWNLWLRIAIIAAAATIFFALVGHQILTQYQKDHQKVVALNQPAPSPSAHIDQSVPAQPPQRREIVGRSSPRFMPNPVDQTPRNMPEAIKTSVTPQTVISAPGGIAIGGGTVINPQ
jgi:hypothetical protein